MDLTTLRPRPTRVPRRWLPRTRRRTTALAALLLAVACTLLLIDSDLTSAVSTRGDAATSSSVPGGDVGPVPRGGLPVDSREPAVTGLHPGLLAALRAASADARDDGIEVRITSGRRSPGYQQHLLDRAVQTYGSRIEARRWVATPTTSAHVTGDAVDVGPTDAAYWMAQHGSRYGLCQAFANEVWHYELLTEPGGPCPEMKIDGSS